MYAEGAGIARQIPSAVAVPRDADDVVALAIWANRTRTPLVPRGSGSGMAGGAVGSGVIVDLSRLNEIGVVDKAARRIFVAPGAIRGEIDRRAREQGLRFPVDPSSGVFCTIGGMVATNAAGARTLRFGATRRWVSALDCVFSDGTRATIRRREAIPVHLPVLLRLVELHSALFRDGEVAALTGNFKHVGIRKESSGYALGGDLIDLLVGSEGTLALFVGVELELAPVPAATASILSAYSSLEAAVDAAAAAREAGASACELLERTFLEVAARESELPLPPNSAAVLLIEVEGHDVGDVAERTRDLGQACTRAGATAVTLALDADAELRIWHLRHAASPILARLDPALKSMQFIEDGCVPPERLPSYVRGVRDALAAQQIRGVIFGHAGDANIHVNPLIDVRLPGWRDRVALLLEEVVALTAELGGTLTGEHGDGRLRTPLLNRVWPASALSTFASVKECLDPYGILNPGVKVPLSGQISLDEIKYDPALTPLPAAARSALDEVELKRAYAQFRLDLLHEHPGGPNPA